MKNAEEIQRLKKEINEVLTREEIIWSQRSRALWIKWGDRNTKFFHAKASQRQRKNCIMGLMDSEGRWQEDQKGIESTILEYFSTMFKIGQPVSFDASLIAIQTPVSPEMNDMLTAEFKAEEVQSALNQMHPTKTPGPDGMSPIFYQKYWDIIGNSIIDYVLNTFKLVVMSSGLNDTYICLIPKVKSPKKNH